MADDVIGQDLNFENPARREEMVGRTDQKCFWAKEFAKQSPFRLLGWAGAKFLGPMNMDSKNPARRTISWRGYGFQRI